MFLPLFEEPHEEPKSVRCWLKPTKLVLRGARRVRGPSLVVVEKDRAAGENEEKVLVSGDAYGRGPRGTAERSDDVEKLPWMTDAEGMMGRSAEAGTEAMNSGLSGCF